MNKILNNIELGKTYGTRTLEGEYVAYRDVDKYKIVRTYNTAIANIFVYDNIGSFNSAMQLLAKANKWYLLD